MAANPSEEAMRDATSAVLHTQELAGIDVVADGELYRFDPNHPETNGMIDYFLRPLRNIRTTISRTEELRFRNMPGMQYRNRPGGVVEGQLGEGTLNLPRDYQRARSLTRSKIKIHAVVSPYMLTKTLVDRHYKSCRRL